MIPIPILDGLFQVGNKLLDRLWPDPAQKAAAAMELEKMRQTGELAQLASDTDLAKAQIAVNMEEAKSTNWFVAGWRPAVGWVCAFGLAYVAILEPMLRFAAVMFGYTGDFPVIDTDLTLQVLLGMLGLGAMRTAEKIKGTEANR